MSNGVLSSASQDNMPPFEAKDLTSSISDFVAQPGTSRDAPLPSTASHSKKPAAAPFGTFSPPSIPLSQFMDSETHAQTSNSSTYSAPSEASSRLTNIGSHFPPVPDPFAHPESDGESSSELRRIQRDIASNLAQIVPPDWNLIRDTALQAKAKAHESFQRSEEAHNLAATALHAAQLNFEASSSQMKMAQESLNSATSLLSSIDHASDTSSILEPKQNINGKLEQMIVLIEQMEQPVDPEETQKALAQLYEAYAKSRFRTISGSVSKTRPSITDPVSARASASIPSSLNQGSQPIPSSSRLSNSPSITPLQSVSSAPSPHASTIVVAAQPPVERDDKRVPSTTTETNSSPSPDPDVNGVGFLGTAGKIPLPPLRWAEDDDTPSAIPLLAQDSHLPTPPPSSSITINGVQSACPETDALPTATPLVRRPLSTQHFKGTPSFGSPMIVSTPSPHKHSIRPGSIPPIAHLPCSSTGTTPSLENVKIDSQGRDTGNIPILPAAFLPPISPEMSRVNRRHVLDDLDQDQDDTMVKAEPESVQPQFVWVDPSVVRSPQNVGGNSPSTIKIVTSPSYTSRLDIRKGNGNRRKKESPISPALVWGANISTPRPSLPPLAQEAKQSQPAAQLKKSPQQPFLSGQPSRLSHDPAMGVPPSTFKSTLDSNPSKSYRSVSKTTTQPSQGTNRASSPSNLVGPSSNTVSATGAQKPPQYMPFKNTVRASRLGDHWSPQPSQPGPERYVPPPRTPPPYNVESSQRPVGYDSYRPTGLGQKRSRDSNDVDDYPAARRDFSYPPSYDGRRRTGNYRSISPVPPPPPQPLHSSSSSSSFGDRRQGPPPPRTPPLPTETKYISSSTMANVSPSGSSVSDGLDRPTLIDRIGTSSGGDRSVAVYPGTVGNANTIGLNGTPSGPRAFRGMVRSRSRRGGGATVIATASATATAAAATAAAQEMRSLQSRLADPAPARDLGSRLS